MRIGLFAGAQSPTPGATQVSGDSSAAKTASGASVQAVLNKSIDTKKAKQGGEVTAKTTEEAKVSSAITIPRNTKLIGHVTEVKAYEKGKFESSVAILFDKAVLKGGQEVPIHATIQAIAPPVQMLMPTDSAEPNPPMGGSAAGNQSSGGLVGGATRTAGAEVGSVADTAGGVASNTGAAVGSSVGATGTGNPARLSADSQGGIGIRDVRLGADAGSSMQGSVLTSGSGNVHLDGGTRLVLRVSEQ